MCTGKVHNPEIILKKTRIPENVVSRDTQSTVQWRSSKDWRVPQILVYNSLSQSMFLLKNSTFTHYSVF